MRPRIEKVCEIAYLHRQMHLHLGRRRVDDTLLLQGLVVPENGRHLGQQVLNEHSHSIHNLTAKRCKCV